MVGSATISGSDAERPTVGKCLCEAYELLAKDKPPKLKDVPSRQYVSTTLCRQCGHTLKVKLRVRAVDNMEKIRSGHIPQSSEYDMIAQLIKEGEEDVERYQKEIDVLRSTTAKIERDKQMLETYLLDLRCMLSPIRRMPVEVLGEIFGQVCCTVNGDSDNKVVGNDLRSRRLVYMPTLVLASVCSTWRKVVESTPSLWSHIALSYNQAITPPRLLDFFLGLSEPVPLHFHLENVNHVETYTREAETDNNVHKLLRHASRWASVSLGPIAHPFIGREILQQLAYTDLPHLLRVDIGADPEAYPYLEDGPFVMEERTSPLPTRVPKLRSISLDSFGLAISSPIASLRSLELTNIEPHRVMLTLEQLPNLTHLALHQCPIQDPAKSTPNVLAENLKNFFIDWDSSIPPLGDDIYPHEKVLNALTLPALDSLTLVDVAHDGDEFSVRPLMEMFERSQTLGMKLKKLGLWTLDIVDGELIPMLSQGCMSGLVHLRVKERSYTETVTDEVVQALTRSVVEENTEAGTGVSYDVSETAFLPCLTDLDLVVYPRFSSDEFLEMVMSRWYIYDSALTVSSMSSGSSGHGCVASSTSHPGPSLSRLTNLRLSRFTGALYDNLRYKLEELSKEGLKVSFNDPYPFPSWKAESTTMSS